VYVTRDGVVQVPENMFVEPSTGRCYPTNASPYLGVEQLWNHTNLWVNMQLPEPHSDARSNIANMAFDLKVGAVDLRWVMTREFGLGEID
jgi:hypothetical protein